MRTIRTTIAILLGAMLLLVAGAAAADDWVAVKLRGSVFMYVGDEWIRLARGDVVSDQQVVRTQPTGRVVFQRDGETIDVGPSTQLQIIDRTGRRYTTVKQWYGSVEIEAEVQNVQHFAVETPYLAAIVKGTRFVVSSDADSSRVVVKRGRVEVDGLLSGERVVITAGQTARSAPGSGDLSVSGWGASGLAPPAGPGSGGAIGTVFGPRGGSSGPASPGGVGDGSDGGGIIDLEVEAPGVDVDLGVGGGALVDAGAGILGSGVSATVGGEDALSLGLDTPLGGIHLSLPGL